MLKSTSVLIVVIGTMMAHHRLGISKIPRQLLSLYGLCCRLVIRVYSSAALDADTVLVSLPSLDLLV